MYSCRNIITKVLSTKINKIPFLIEIIILLLLFKWEIYKLHLKYFKKEEEILEKKGKVSIHIYQNKILVEEDNNVPNRLIDILERNKVDTNYESIFLFRKYLLISYYKLFDCILFYINFLYLCSYLSFVTFRIAYISWSKLLI